MDEVNGGSGLESSSSTNCPAFALAFLQALPPGSAPPSSQLFRGNAKALTAFPGHRPLGGAVAPPTQAGGAREAEAQPLNKARTRWSAAARLAALHSLASFSFFVLSSRLGHFPPSSAPRPTVACSHSASGCLGFPTALSGQRQAEAGAWAGRRSLGGSTGLEAPEGWGLPEPRPCKAAQCPQSLSHSLETGRPVQPGWDEKMDQAAWAAF